LSFLTDEPWFFAMSHLLSWAWNRDTRPVEGITACSDDHFRARGQPRARLGERTGISVMETQARSFSNQRLALGFAS